jgi:hypothetical protein
MLHLKSLLKKESIATNLTFTQFASKRLQGATKITNDAKEKGGPAILTYHHFVVKLPYYQNAVDGNFNIERTKKLLNTKSNEFCDKIKNMDLSEIGFQRLVGEIEVLGELLLHNNKQ